jgi:methylmalonyl-CoA decarboxylase
LPRIRVDFADHVGTIAFDCYANRNALSAPLIEEVLAALANFGAQRARAVILTSAAPNPVWSSGHDVTELPLADRDPLPFNDPLERLLRAVRELSGPVLAMVHGSVWGGACALIMNSDIVIGDESCAFAITPATLGLPYTASGNQHFMSRLPLNVVKEMFFSAEPIDAQRAERVGIVNQIVPAAELEATTRSLAATIATRSPEANAAFKAQVRILSDAAALSPTTFEYIQGLRRAVYSGADYHEGIQAFLAKRKPRF